MHRSNLTDMFQQFVGELQNVNLMCTLVLHVDPRPSQDMLLGTLNVSARFSSSG